MSLRDVHFVNMFQRATDRPTAHRYNILNIFFSMSNLNGQSKQKYISPMHTLNN